MQTNPSPAGIPHLSPAQQEVIRTLSRLQYTIHQASTLIELLSTKLDQTIVIHNFEGENSHAIACGLGGLSTETIRSLIESFEAAETAIGKVSFPQVAAEAATAIRRKP